MFGGGLTSFSTSFAKSCHSFVFLSKSSGIHSTPPTSRTVAANSQSSEQMPGVVGFGVVVVVVVVVVTVVLTVVSVDVVASLVASLACSRSFSMEIGVVGGVGQPVNAVVALRRDV